MSYLLNRAIAASASMLALSSGIASAQTADQAAPPAGATAAPAADQRVGDIVVTAQRRKERSQDVPISITAFSADRLEQQNISKPQDLQATVPSLVVGANGQGSRESQSFTLRGQGATFQASPGVVVYLNEVPLPSPITLSQQGGPGNFVDLENLQVLAGPQGTLFGRNTTGGAVLLTPRKPQNELGGWIEGQYGNYNNKVVEGALNVPVIPDKLLVRIVGAYHDRDGYTRDVVHNKDLDNTHWYSGRIGITYRPVDGVENYLMVYGSNSSNNGTGLIHKGFNIPGLQGVGFCVDPPLSPPGPSGIAVSCDYYRGLTAQANALGPRATAPGVDPGQDTRTWGAENTTSIDIAEGLVVRNIFSYQRFWSRYYYDGDGTIAQQSDPYTRASKLPADNYQGITEELQLQGNLLDHKLIFTTGAFYYDQKPAGAQGLTDIVYCPAAFTGYCPTNSRSVSVRTVSKALYAQATLDLGLVTPALDRLKLTAGYRHTWDTITGSAYAYTPTASGSYICSDTNNIVASDPQQNCQFGARLKSNAPTWTVGLDYKFLGNVLLYGKISRGYKAGGFNSYAVRPDTRTFLPEHLTSYEGGFKSNFHLGTMPAQFNASYYFSDYSNIQKAAGDFNLTSLASGARINAAKAHVQGVEVETTIRPIRQLELGGNFSYTNFRYTDYKIAANGLPDCSGTIPVYPAQANISCLAGQYIAPYIFSVHGTLGDKLPGNLGDLSLFVSYSYTAPQHTEATVLPPGQPGEKLAAFGLLNASLDWKGIGGSNLDAGLFVNNALNKLYRISNTDVYQTGSLLSWATIYGEPRMYGLRLRYHFGGER